MEIRTYHDDGDIKSTNNAFNWQTVRFVKPTRKAQPRNRLRPKTGTERTAYALATDEEKAAIRLRLWAEAESKILRPNPNTHIGAYCGTTKGQKAAR